MNVRNGTRPKTVFTEATGHVQIEVPRDRPAALSRRLFLTAVIIGLGSQRGEQQNPTQRLRNAAKNALGSMTK